ncbi:MAG: Lrp/AsnC family transcriptional regulator, partial [Promethearchaeota archaeon]
MDEIDLLIIKKLFENSRLTYRELAEITNMSVSAVHKCIKSLKDNKIITAYTARPSFIALKNLWVIIFGTSTAKSIEAVLKELGRHESVEFAAIAGGKFLYISGFHIALADIKVEPFWIEFLRDNVRAELIYPPIL